MAGDRGAEHQVGKLQHGPLPRLGLQFGLGRLALGVGRLGPDPALQFRATIGETVAVGKGELSAVVAILVLGGCRLESRIDRLDRQAGEIDAQVGLGDSIGGARQFSSPLGQCGTRRAASHEPLVQSRRLVRLRHAVETGQALRQGRAPGIRHARGLGLLVHGRIAQAGEFATPALAVQFGLQARLESFHRRSRRQDREIRRMLCAEPRDVRRVVLHVAAHAGNAGKPVFALGQGHGHRAPGVQSRCGLVRAGAFAQGERLRRLNPFAPPGGLAHLRCLERRRDARERFGQGLEAGLLLTLSIPARGKTRDVILETCQAQTRIEPVEIG